MRKISTLFKRDFDNNGQIIPKYSENTEWVQKGEGEATRKYDGTSVLIRGGKMYKRLEVKPGKTAPDDFEEIFHDNITDKRIGWVQVGWGSEDQWHRDAIVSGDPDDIIELSDGTYELVGPKIQGNPERLNHHHLVKHSDAELFENVPVTFDGLREWLNDKDIEGIVWHHPDGRMVKIKKKDFHLKRVYKEKL